MEVAQIGGSGTMESMTQGDAADTVQGDATQRDETSTASTVGTQVPATFNALEPGLIEEIIKKISIEGLFSFSVANKQNYELMKRTLNAARIINGLSQIIPQETSYRELLTETEKQIIKTRPLDEQKQLLDHSCIIHKTDGNPPSGDLLEVLKAKKTTPLEYYEMWDSYYLEQARAIFEGDGLDDDVMIQRFLDGDIEDGQIKEEKMFTALLNFARKYDPKTITILTKDDEIYHGVVDDVVDDVIEGGGTPFVSIYCGEIVQKFNFSDIRAIMYLKTEALGPRPFTDTKQRPSTAPIGSGGTRDSEDTTGRPSTAPARLQRTEVTIPEDDFQNIKDDLVQWYESRKNLPRRPKDLSRRRPAE